MSHWLQILTLVLYAFHFAVACRLSGKPRPPYNPVDSLASILLSFGLLYAAGFWAVWGWAP